MIAKTLVVSLAQYLMTVNGISTKNLLTMEKNIRKFSNPSHKRRRYKHPKHKNQIQIDQGGLAKKMVVPRT